TLVHANAAVLACGEHEHERAAGAWQSEWAPLSEALALTGGAAAAVGEAFDGLEVRPDRMRENLEATGGALMAESVVMTLSGRVGQQRARKLVDAAAGQALDSRSPFRDVLVGDEEVRGELSEEEIDRALDPAAYLGSSDAFIDRALARHRGYLEERS
ncbi:MAG: hypothetical protein WB771_09290, partial [Solirubrobacterales bacterium]